MPEWLKGLLMVLFSIYLSALTLFLVNLTAEGMVAFEYY
jgi:hypothetical protein